MDNRTPAPVLDFDGMIVRLFANYDLTDLRQGKFSFANSHLLFIDSQ